MTYFLLYMLIGAAVGTFSGLLGLGGGVIMIPCLAWAFSIQGIHPDLIMHMAAGTSLSVMIFTSIASLRNHLKHGAQVWPIFKRLIVGIIVGTILGAIFGHFLPNRILEILFGIFILFISFRLLLAIESKPTRTLPGSLGMFSIATLIGGKSGMLGIGGGAVTTIFLSYCNVPIRNVIAISAATTSTVATFGTISFMLTGSFAHNLPSFTTGYIYWPAFLGILLTGPLFARLGAFFSHKLPVAILKRILGAVLLLVAINMLWP
jgi:uncharacterized membrane protein YfcA